VKIFPDTTLKAVRGQPVAVHGLLRREHNSTLAQHTVNPCLSPDAQRATPKQMFPREGRSPAKHLSFARSTPGQAAERTEAN